MALAFDDAFVFVEEEASVELAALGAALEHVAIGEGLDGFAVVAVAADEIVIKGEEVAGGAWVSLAAGAAAELVIDAAAIVAGSTNDVEAAELGDAGTQDDIDPAAGHIRGDGDGAGLAGEGDEMGFVFFVAGVEDVVGNVGQGAADTFGGFDAFASDEDGAAGQVMIPDGLDDGAEFCFLVGEECVGLIDADAGFVGGDDFDGEVVDLGELFGLGGGGAGHAAEVFVLEDVVLEGDGGEDAAGFLDGEALLFFEGGVEAGGPAALVGGAAFVFVDGDDFPVADEVIDVAGEEMVGVEGVVESGEEAVGSVVDLLDLEELFGLGEAGVGDFDVLVAGIDLEVEAGVEGAGGGAGAAGGFGDSFVFAGEDEGDAGFIDEDGVGFVDDGGVEGALDAVVF